MLNYQRVTRIGYRCSRGKLVNSPHCWSLESHSSRQISIPLCVAERVTGRDRPFENPMGCPPHGAGPWRNWKRSESVPGELRMALDNQAVPPMDNPAKKIRTWNFQTQTTPKFQLAHFLLKDLFRVEFLTHHMICLTEQLLKAHWLSNMGMKTH